MKIKNKILSLLKYRRIRFPESIQDPSELDWPEGWRVLHYDNIPHVTRELGREVGRAHVLYNLPACALGKKRQTDDYLFQVEAGDHNVALVHLTWKKEKDPAWPHTTLYESFQAWLASEVI